MKIFVRAFGPLQDALGRKPIEIELAENASVDDAISLIVKEWILPVRADLWDKSKQKFNIPVVIMVANKDVQDSTQRLFDGQVLFLVTPMAGGY